MTDTVTFSHECVILDACCVLNFYASRQMNEILACKPVDIAVADFVNEEEALWIYGGPKPNVRSERERIDLEPLINDGLIKIATLNSAAEQENFVSFAAALGDDGEAMTAAIAFERNWAIATDDRKALSFLRREMPHIQLISTLEFVKHWVDETERSPEVVQRVLRNIQERAVYKPGENHPLYDWWKTYV